MNDRRASQLWNEKHENPLRKLSIKLLKEVIWQKQILDCRTCSKIPLGIELTTPTIYGLVF